MKEMKITCVVILMAASCFAAWSVRAAEKTYTFGYVTGLSMSQNTQLHSIFEKLLGAVSKREHFKVKGTLIRSNEELTAAAAAGKIDIAQTNDHAAFWRLAEQHGFQPVMSYSFFGKKMNSQCIYVKSDSKWKSWKNLEGARVAMNSEEDVYYLLRNIVGAPPEKFFKIVPAPSGDAAIFSVILGQADAAFNNNQFVEYMKIANPGPLKSITELECSPPAYYPPVLRSKHTPQAIGDLISRYTANMNKEPEFKDFRPLFKMVKIKFHQVTVEDYAPMFELFRKAEKNGWSKDYRKFRTEMEKQEVKNK